MPRLCILRHTNDGKADGHAQLIAFGEPALFQLAWPVPLFESRLNCSPGLWLHEDWPWTDERINGLGNTPWVGGLYWTLNEITEETRAWLDTPLDPGEQLLFLLMHDSTRRDIISVYRAFLYESPDTFDSSYQHYVEHYCGAQHRGWTDKDRLIFTVPFETISALYHKHMSHPSWSLWKKAVRDHLTTFMPAPSASATEQETSGTITIAISAEIAYRVLSTSPGLSMLHMIEQARAEDRESEEQLLARKATGADRLVRVPTGPYSEKLMDDCGCEGTLEEVIIV